MPDYRCCLGLYPVYALLGIVVCTHRAAAPRGQKDLAMFARRLSSAQRAALGVRATAEGEYPAPGQPTFRRLFKRLSAPRVERALLDYQHQVRGAPSATEIVVLDGKVPAHSGGLNVVSAVTSPSQYFLGSEVVAAKTNEIPAARALLERLDLTGRLVSFDAMHPQDATARAIVMEHGGDFLLTVKANQPNVQTAVQTHLPDPGARFLIP